MPVGCEGNRIRPDLPAGIVANGYGNIHRLRGHTIDGDTRGGACGIVKRQDIGIGVAAFQGHDRLLAVGIVAKNHKATNAAIGGELCRANGGRRIQ